MRILLNDFGGYPFPVQLSKYLAAPGCEVMHTFVSNIQTPHGDMRDHGASPYLTIHPILLQTEFSKYSFLGRFRGEYDFARKVTRLIEEFRPDIVISANTPLLAQGVLLKKCKTLGIKFIYWCQDIHSIALAAYLRQRLRFLAGTAARYFKWKETRLLEQSDYVITIAPAFNAIFASWGIRQKHISVIPNWGPVSEIPMRPKSNDWAARQGLDGKLVILYSGTLGIKHNPLLISAAAQHFAELSHLAFVVISEGAGADMLAAQKAALELDNLLILPYQEYALLPDVLATADILLSILEPGAALFSVPSKVLTYLCAGKPILLSVPAANLSAQIVQGARAGYTTEPGDTAGFYARLAELIATPALRDEMGKRGRDYAEKNFTVAEIANKFTVIIKQLYE